jgi:hypothetical protein
MNLVRCDLSWKLRNSSTTDTVFLDEVTRCIENWKPGRPFSFPRKGELALIQVENEFHTYDPGENPDALQ